MKRITTIFLIVLFGHLGMIAQTDTTAYGVVKICLSSMSN